jgi:SAM-dependent methyltransferase
VQQTSSCTSRGETHRALEGTRQVQGKSRLHLGCGLVTPPDWLNVDGSWNARLGKYPRLRRALVTGRLIPNRSTAVAWNEDICVLDVRRPLPWPADTFDAVYASHLLEHLYRDQAVLLLQECLRVIVPGGVIRLVVPDLEHIIRSYLEHRESFMSNDGSATWAPADEFMRRLLMKEPNAPHGNVIHQVYSRLLDFHSHKWMYDAQSLRNCMQYTGFVNVEQRGYLDSHIVGVEAVEQASRVLEGAGICIEGIKPDVSRSRCEELVAAVM